jgi:hypothetical protein
MASGDVINDVLSVGNTLVSFQPAATVQIVITFLSGNTVGGTILQRAGITDGTLVSYVQINQDDNVFAGMKMMINNSNYLGLKNASASTTAYSGIQTK